MLLVLHEGKPGERKGAHLDPNYDAYFPIGGVDVGEVRGQAAVSLQRFFTGGGYGLTATV